MKYLNENKDFITLVQLIRENSEFSKRILTILHLERSKRKSLLQKTIRSMRLNNEPKYIIELVGYLTDDEIVDRILDIVSEK